MRKGTLLLVNFIDHVDTHLYKCLSPLIVPLFLPPTDSSLSIIAFYGVYWASSFIAYPLGGTLFSFLA